MRGHGTYLEGESLLSSLAGVVMQTNKLIRVKPVKSRSGNFLEFCWKFNFLKISLGIKAKLVM